MTEKVWGPGEEYVMGSAFVSLVDYLSRQPEAVEAFERDSGLKWTAPRSSIEAMIDDATGAGREYARQFIRWVQEHHWGEPLPPSLEEKLRA